MNHKVYGFGLIENTNCIAQRLSKFEKEADSKFGRRHTAYWGDVLLYAETLPELETEAENLVVRHLGYLPHLCLRIPHEVFLRALIALHRQHGISDAEFTSQAAEHVKHIRNTDLNNCGWADPYTERRLVSYNTTLAPYKEAARQRLTQFLGYTPALEHSCDAEILVRELCAKANYKPTWELNGFDYKALNIIKYREALFSLGKDAADQSDLYPVDPMEGQINANI